jgi:hypothetical protein
MCSCHAHEVIFSTSFPTLGCNVVNIPYARCNISNSLFTHLNKSSEFFIFNKPWVAWLGINFQQEQRCFSLPLHPDHLWCPSRLLTNGHGVKCGQSRALLPFTCLSSWYGT